MDDTFLAGAMDALGSPVRLRIFRTLADAGEAGMAAGDLARALDLSPSLLSHHLKVLADAGLLVRSAVWRAVVYSLAFAAAARLHQEMDELLRGVVTPAGPVEQEARDAVA